MKGQPGKAFRKGLTTELKRSGADVEAVERSVGHRRRSVRTHYLDESALVDLIRAAVEMIPRICVRVTPGIDARAPSQR